MARLADYFIIVGYDHEKTGEFLKKVKERERECGRERREGERVHVVYVGRPVWGKDSLA